MIFWNTSLGLKLHWVAQFYNKRNNYGSKINGNYSLAMIWWIKRNIDATQLVKKLKTNVNQEMLDAIRSRIFCFPVWYLRIRTWFFLFLYTRVKKRNVKEKYRLRVSKNWALRKIFGCQGQAVTGDSQKLPSQVVILTIHYRFHGFWLWTGIA